MISTKQRGKNPWYPLLSLTVTSFLLYEYTCYSCACYDTFAALATVHLLYLLLLLATLLAPTMLTTLATLFEVATPATFNRWY